MKIKLYNSFTKKKEIFHSAKEKEVNIYVCGVTVYDYCHLGHARGAINFDLLRRFLQAVGYKVNFVKNYTDIDDKIIQQAKQLKINTKQLTEKMIAEHDKDMESLFVQKADKTPKATENIAGMIKMIEQLIAKGYSYENGGDVFFRVKKFQNYGKLSGKNIADLQAGIRVEINELKENSLDFVLWKASKKNEPSWDSPWGAGRPGWHIECSCMCQKFIDGKLDIHGGGADLIFPHHENEIAQSESLLGKKMANYWMHNGMIEIGGKKMSKSLGNFTKIRELVIQPLDENITQGYDPCVIRFFILQSHYRQNLIFSPEALQSASKALASIYYNLILFEEQTKNKLPVTKKIAEFKININAFLERLADDLNTPQAIAQVFDWSNRIPLAVHQKKMQVAKEYANQVLLAMKILGIVNNKPIQNWLNHRKEPIQKENIKNITKYLAQADNTHLKTKNIEKAARKVLLQPSEQNIKKIFYLLMNKREELRINKDWENSDKIRDLLLKLGVQVKDKPKGSVWQYC